MKDQPLATIEFYNGDRIFLEKDRRWHGENREFVRLTNILMDSLPDDYRPDWAHDVAYEIAEQIGTKAKVIQVVKQQNDAPPGTLF